MNKVQLKEKIAQKIEGMGQEDLLLVDRFLDSLNTCQPLNHPINSAPQRSEEEHQAFVRSLRGKYRHLALSSESFDRIIPDK